MNNKTIMVLNGYLNLTDEEKNNFNKAIDEHDRKGGLDKIRNKEHFNEEVRRMTGPRAIAPKCDCCGR